MSALGRTHPSSADDALEVEVETRSGRLRGRVVELVAEFLGVPYGRSGPEQRFRRSVPPEPWVGVLEAFDYGPAAPQPRPPRSAEVARVLGEELLQPMSEDCLRLNLWTPSTDGSLPVLVWLHGGGFTAGSGTSRATHGARLAGRGDVVVVSPSHRLGLLGFLDLRRQLGEAAGAALNVGMLDLVDALGWVQENIGAFGGDPGNVTIFGESGGGGKVATLLAMAEAGGRFQRAVIQSGFYLHGPGMDGAEPELAQATAAAVLDHLGLGQGDAGQLFELPVEALVEAQMALERQYSPGPGPRPFMPVLDASMLPRHPGEAAASCSPDVPVLLGSNTEETRFHLLMGDPGFAADPGGFELSTDQLRTRIRRWVGERSDDVIATYRRLRPGASNVELFVAITSDEMRAGAIRFAERRLAGGWPAFVYLFAWRSRVLGGALGAAHGLEVPFVFGTLDSRPATKEGPQSLSAAMLAAWAEFARSGEPRAGGLPSWPAYDARRRPTMWLDERPAVVDDPHGEERKIWEAL